MIITGCVIAGALDSLQQYFQGQIYGRPTEWQSIVFAGAEWLLFAALTPIVRPPRFGTS